MRRVLQLGSAVSLFLIALALIPVPATSFADAPFTVYLVPDPQGVVGLKTCSGSKFMNALVDWGIAHKNDTVNGTALNAKGFILLGDCANRSWNDNTDSGSNTEETIMVNAWARAEAAGMFVLRVVGNHDYKWLDLNGGRINIGHAWRTDTGGAWRPAALSAIYGSGMSLPSGGTAYWGGHYADPTFPESSANTYMRLVIGSRKILIFGLEYYPRSPVLLWANGIANTYPDHEVWAFTHGYLDTTGLYVTRADAGGPVGIGNLADAPDSNAGDQMWDGSDMTWAGFKTWARLKVVAGGHQVNGYNRGWIWAHNTVIADTGQAVEEIFSNAQGNDDINYCGGNPAGTADGTSDVMHLTPLRIWPTTVEMYMVSTNSSKWIGAQGVVSQASPVQLFSVPFRPPAFNSSKFVVAQ